MKMINYKTQIIVCAVLLISIHECVFGETLNCFSNREEISNVEKCKEEVFELCDGCTTATDCKTTIFLNKLYKHYRNENYSRQYFDYIKENSVLSNIINIEMFCTSYSDNTECIAKIKKHFKIKGNLEINPIIAAYHHALNNMTIHQFPSTDTGYSVEKKDYARDYFIHMKDCGMLRDITLPYFSWCEMIGCREELKLLCDRYTHLTHMTCKEHIFNNKLYNNYEEGSYSKRYFDAIVEATDLNAIDSIETFCEFCMEPYNCVAEIIMKFNLQDVPEVYQINYGFNYAWKEITLNNFTENEVYSKEYFMHMNTMTTINSNMDPYHWCSMNYQMVID